VDAMVDKSVERLLRLMNAVELSTVVGRTDQNVTCLSAVSFHGKLSQHLDFAASRRGVIVIWPRQSPPNFVHGPLGQRRQPPARLDCSDLMDYARLIKMETEI
jgi:hypothetical protein